MRRTDVVVQIRKVLQEVALTAKAIPFASEARGDARPDSDIDLLILMDGDRLSLEYEEVVTLSLYDWS